MARVRQIQQRFTAGEIDPAMLGRTDIDQYYSAAEKLLNVVTTPQGGFKRRPGLAFRDKALKQITRETVYTTTAPNGGTTANLTDNNQATLFTTTTAMNATNPYVVAQVDLGSSKPIGKLELSGISLSVGTTAGEFFLQTSPDASAWTTRGASLDFSTTAKDFTRRVIASSRYVRIVRIGATNLGAAVVSVKDFQVWTEGAASNIKMKSFVFNNDQTYNLVFTDKNIAVYRNKQYVIDIRAEEYTSAFIPYISTTQEGDTMIIFNINVPTKKFVRGTANDIWTLSNVVFTKVPLYNFVPVTTSPAVTLTPSAATGNITLTASAAAFTAASVDQYVEGNGGRARIVSYTSTTVVKAIVEIPFIDTTVIGSGNWQYLTGYEPAWSATRGWPGSGAFHEARLVIGGSRDRPTTLWLSRIADYFDFDLGQLLDDDAIEFTISGEYNQIVNVYAGRSLMVFTTGAEYVASQQLGDPLTPANMNLKRQTSVGSQPLLPVAEFEGGVLYNQRGGQSIQEFVFDTNQDAYSNNFVSLLSSHLVKVPVDYSLRRATSTEEGAYLLLVRDTGGLSMANILRSQNITSFAAQTTDGLFKACGVEDAIMWLAIDRTVNGDTRTYLETFETDNLVDSGVRLTSGLPLIAMTGLGHLEGRAVKVIIDDAISSNATVTNGQVVLDRAPTTSIEIGLDFTTMVKDLPVEIPQIGTAMGMKFNVSEVTLRLLNTANIAVNGKNMNFRKFGPSGGGSPLDTPPPKFTGLKKLRGFLGYDLTGQITITQNEPLPMNVLAMVKRVRAT